MRSKRHEVDISWQEREGQHLQIIAMSYMLTWRPEILLEPEIKHACDAYRWGQTLNR